MSRFIQLIDLDEIKALRITCGKCGAYWSVPIEPTGNNSPPSRCIYCETKIPHKDINDLSQKINHIIQGILQEWKCSIELETDMEKPPED